MAKFCMRACMHARIHNSVTRGSTQPPSTNAGIPLHAMQVSFKRNKQNKKCISVGQGIPGTRQKENLGEAGGYRHFTHAAAERGTADFRLASLGLLLLPSGPRGIHLRLKGSQGHQTATRVRESC